MQDKLETINRRAAAKPAAYTLTPYLGQIWHATVGQWSMLTSLISSGSA